MRALLGTTASPRVPEPADGDERSVLLGWLAFHRNALEAKCAGPDEQQLASRPVPPSPLSLRGLVRHLTEMERVYAVWTLGPKSELRFVWGDYTDDGRSGTSTVQVVQEAVARQGECRERPAGQRVVERPPADVDVRAFCALSGAAGVDDDMRRRANRR